MGVIFLKLWMIFLDDCLDDFCKRLYYEILEKWHESCVLKILDPGSLVI